MNATYLTLAVAALAPAFVAAQESGAGRRPSEPHAPFSNILWMQGTAGSDEGVLGVARQIGFDTVQVSRGSDGRVATGVGLDVYRHQLVPKGSLELTDDQWRELLARFERHRDPAQLTREKSLTDPLVRADLVIELGRELEGLAATSLRAASIGDELSFTKQANPLDLDRDPATLRAFRRFLRTEYGTSERLSKAWGDNVTFVEALPWSLDAIRQREASGGALPRNLAPYDDLLEFCDRTFARVIIALVDKAQAVRRGLPVGLTGIQPPLAFGGHDYARIVPSLGLVETYDIGGARDLADCLAQPRALRWSTLFVPRDDAPRIAMLRLAAAYGEAVAHGEDGVVVWSHRGLIDETASEPRPSAHGEVFARILAAYRVVCERFAGARISRDPVWIVESRASVRAHWMIDSALDGDTWIRRLSSYEAENSTSLAARQSWLELLGDLGVQPQFVPAKQVAALLSDPGAPRPKLVVLPATLALADTTCRALADFVESGGRVVADYGCAYYDDNLQRRQRPALDPLFGIARRNVPQFDDLRVSNGRVRPGTVRTERGVAVAVRGVRGGVAEVVRSGQSPAESSAGAASALRPLAEYVQLERGVGRGVATLLNVAVAEYRKLRLDPQRPDPARELRERVRRVLDDAGVRPRVEVRGNGLPTLIERLLLTPRDGVGTLLAIRLDGVDDQRVGALLSSRGPVEAELLLGQRFRATEITTTGSRPLGVGHRFSFVLDPWRPSFFELRPVE